MRQILALLTLLVTLGAAHADPPAGYYNAASGQSGAALKSALHGIIDGHTVIPYSSLETPLRALWQDPANSANILLVYSQTSVAKTSSSWNREHMWPRSRGNSDQAGPDDSDLFHIAPCDGDVNSLRSNRYYDTSNPADGGYNAQAPEAPLCSYDADSWQPAPTERGDIARALFYMAVRYDGTEANTTDLELVSTPPTGPLMGKLSTLLAWHAADPPDAAERGRNDAIYTNYQHNRNPFIDHPEWVEAIWGASGGTPAAQALATTPNAIEQPTIAGAFTVTLSQAAAANVTVQFAMSGAAQFGEYTLSGAGVSFQAGTGTGSLVIPANATSATVTLTAVADAVAESAESAVLTIVAGTGYTVSATNAATVTINDAPPATPAGVIAEWNCDAPPNAAALYPASSGVGNLDFSQWDGSLASFLGATGNAVALVDQAGNNSWIDVRISTAGFKAISIEFKTRGTSTGFNSGTWSASADSVNFTPLAGVNTATTNTNWIARTVDFSGIAAINNAPAVTLRYTLSGCTSASGNNRLDDIVVRGTPLPVVSVATADGNAAEMNSDPATIVFAANAAAPAGGLTATFQLTGTATRPGVAGADYVLAGAASYNAAAGTGTIVIPAGAASATLTVTPSADFDPVEFDETVQAALVTGSGYAIGTPSSAGAMLHDATPYTAAWASRFPDFTGALAAPTADVDGDGWNGLAEFAFDLDPLAFEPDSGPVLAEADLPDPNAGGVLRRFATITFTRRTDAPNLTYTPQRSDDLGAWLQDLVFVSAQSGTVTERVTYRTPAPQTAAPVFLRVRVTAP